jgi:hypothetical protein
LNAARSLVHQLIISQVARTILARERIGAGAAELGVRGSDKDPTSDHSDHRLRDAKGTFGDFCIRTLAQDGSDVTAIAGDTEFCGRSGIRSLAEAIERRSLGVLSPVPEIYRNTAPA